MLDVKKPLKLLGKIQLIEHGALDELSKDPEAAPDEE